MAHNLLTPLSLIQGTAYDLPVGDGLPYIIDHFSCLAAIYSDNLNSLQVQLTVNTFSIMGRGIVWRGGVWRPSLYC